MKKLFLILAAGLITGTLLIGLMEGFVRLAIPDHEIYPHPRGLYTTSPTIGYVLTPGFRGAAITREYHTTLAINAWGARGPEITTKQEGELRIIGLGDSFTFAQQLPIRDTFLKVCERQLRANQPAKAKSAITRLLALDPGDELKSLAKGDLYEIDHLQIGMTAPDFTTKTLEGKSVSLKSFRGKAVMLNFWASW